ncbi:hypothetical protein EVAR_51898_1 [Eumeta japonica]|uniref:Uncharacterized protein n=1 Tax=Eumeta variegata TaxID=151549 RepID=A0A4C1XI61_EUMVA|nr:hypothetical protein EVAR_51898_1 [Eumeta japonica]
MEEAKCDSVPCTEGPVAPTSTTDFLQRRASITRIPSAQQRMLTWGFALQKCGGELSMAVSRNIQKLAKSTSDYVQCRVPEPLL